MKKKTTKSVLTGVIAGMMIVGLSIGTYSEEVLIEDIPVEVEQTTEELEELEEVLVLEESAEVIEEDAFSVIAEDEIDEDNDALEDILFEEVTEKEQDAAANIIESGSCGTNVSWGLDSDGVLTISGNGDMMDYGSRTPPYGSLPVSSVIIEQGVTKIGSGAFRGCQSMKSISIPSSVVQIWEYAFVECYSLTSITIPNGVTDIGYRVFYGCKGLKEVILSDSVTDIDVSVFEGCTSLTSVTLSNNITSIPSGTFENCSSLANITIPDSVTKIDAWAFRGCSSLKSIFINKNINYISQQQVFEGCDNLESIIIDPDNTVYDSRDNCNAIIEKASNTLICGFKNSTIPASVTRINGYAFEGCKIMNITVPNNVAEMGSGVFNNCDCLKSVILPPNITLIENQTFKGCTSLTNITIPKSVTNIGYYAFSGCSSLTEITIPDSVTSIGNFAFEGCSSLTNITIPNSVTSLGYRSFADCSNLTSITLSPKVNYIGEKVFNNCSLLTMYGYSNSMAEKYASENNIPFVALDAPVINIETGPGVSDITYLVMSDAAYKNFDQYKWYDLNSGEVLGENVTKLKSGNIQYNYELEGDEKYNWGDLYRQCLSTWAAVDVMRDDNTGFFAVTFERGDDIVVAFRGSGDLDSEALWNDWLIDDAGMGLLQIIGPQINQAIDYIHRIQTLKTGKNISITGHSLGGGLGIVAANATNLKAVVFDAAPSLTTSYYCMWNIMGGAFNGIDKWTYWDYMNIKCPVGGIERDIKNAKLLKTYYTGASLFRNHERDSIITFNEETNRYELSKPEATNSYNSGSRWEKTVDHLQLREIANSIPSLKTLLLAMSSTSGILHDILSLTAVFDELTKAGTLRLGTSIANTISGTPFYIHTDVIYGGEGDDKLTGYAGDDYMIGGPGNNSLDGGNGNDTYVFFKDHLGSGINTIYDKSGNDTILFYNFSSGDQFSFNGNKDYTEILCNGQLIVRVSTLRYWNPNSSFVIKVYAGAENVTTRKLEEFNQWKSIRSFRVACPVSVDVLDADGNVVATLEDGQEKEEHTSFANMYCVYNGDTGEYEKYVDLEEGYSLMVRGTAAGSMDIQMTETDQTGKEQVYTANDISVTAGKEFAVDSELKKVISDDLEIGLQKAGEQTINPTPEKPNEPQEEKLAEEITIKKKPTIKAPSATKNKITVKWTHFKHSAKSAKKIWNKIKEVQVQCATDKKFKKIVKTSTVSRNKTKATIKGLKKNTTYYVRIRYMDGPGYSKWSKVKKVKTKKK